MNHQPLGRATRWFLTAWLLAFGLTAVSRADSSGVTLATSRIGQLSGEQIYGHICQACHMSEGQGAAGAGHYPQLAGDPVLRSWQLVALTVIGGRNGMPGFGLPPEEAMEIQNASLSDEQIAEVVNYVRSHFGNHYKDKVSAAQVAALRRKLPPR
jgi:mono/diheme cytochrome c family protein